MLSQARQDNEQPSFSQLTRGEALVMMWEALK
jgi:hypothetical protein